MASGHLYCNATYRNISPEAYMTAATITPAQDTGLRHHFGALLGNVRDFAVELYAAHGGWRAPAAGTRQQGQASLMSLAAEAQAHSPSLSNELRNLASRG
jgi:hypothetical protein